MVGKPVVLITGGAGFIAQHLIRELQTEYKEVVKEIRVADRKPFKNFLDYPDRIRVTGHVVDCLEKEKFAPLLDDVSVVFHLCGTNFCYTNDDRRTLQWRENYTVTEVVLETMAQKNVPMIVFLSDASCFRQAYENSITPLESKTLTPPKNYMLGSYGEAKFQTETLVRKANGTTLADDYSNNTIYMLGSCGEAKFQAETLVRKCNETTLANGELPKQYYTQYMLGSYGEAKFQAETLVRKANGTTLANGNKLSTIVIRPTITYGEGDSWLVPTVLRMAQENNGELPHFDAMKIQFVYAGNCASVLTKGWDLLVKDPDQFGSEVFFCNDGNGNSQIKTFDFLKPFVLAAGFKFADKPWAFEWLISKMWLLGKLRTLAGYFGVGLFGDLPTAAAIYFVGTSFTYSSTKVRLVMDWLPKYDSAEAYTATLKWWKDNYKTVLNNQ